MTQRHSSAPLLKVEHLTKHFNLSGGKVVHAVDDVSFTITRGKTLGLVGESGCGKSSCARTIIRIYEPTSGSILLDGEDISGLTQKQLLPHRRKMQMIFQDPYASLNPRMTVSSIIAEPMKLQQVPQAQIDERVAELIEQVGLKKDHLNRYPHEFSGGQRQRIGIARALAMHPEFVVCDEPISALDVSIQAQVINMLEELQQQMGMTYLFVSHDLSMVRHISHRVGVMYLGHMVELADVEELYSHMQHPYTQALMSAVPIADPDLAAQTKRIVLQGDVPQPIDPTPGCPFASRCRDCRPVCREARPQMRQSAPGHYVACHL